ncbi:MAG: bifunctional DNA-formamidopyrimidine glycosylase/DNA-(apurinic or apyrimidinic site) lyase [Acidobacteria bacterium]|nr:MAG: bifunctional DNA-formamidopyrimidine glycosylase/DNA-(apurinic or apyrimidinic site) lyase [Acidobacteriota bacterium]
MPELPEVETVARGLRSQILGQRIEDVRLRRASVLRGNPEAFAGLAGSRIAAIERAGKYLVFSLEGAKLRWQLLFHLGMTGQLVLAAPEAPLAAHTHAHLRLSGGRELRFRDPRRFGKIALAPAPAGGGFALELGIAPGAEPLEIAAPAFVALFRGRAAPIKSALMNQKLLRGLGNIYADESLFRAGIHPRARRVSAPRLRRLRLAIREVLHEAIAAGGSSISDYVDSRGEPGWFHLQHRVYGRTGEPCPGCGRPIRRTVLAGRSAHFCAHCQKP